MGNVGEAVLAIIGDSKPFERTLNNLDKTVGRSADRIGESIGSRLGAATGRALRIGITAAAAGAAVAAGAALSKGFQRFADIEDATAALTITLGDAGKAAEFLGEVLEVVEGTPFSLDQFATVAKNLVAMQIEAGKVPGILRAIGEAGAATGKGAEGVNTVADAIGRMATGAKLSLEPIRALEDQGIPALTILANKFGVTTSRMAKDISSGAIDSSKAIDLLTDGILRGTTGVSGLSVEAEKAAENLEGLGESAVTADERLADLRDNVSDVQQRMGDLARDAGDAREALEDALRPASAREMESAILSVERSLNRQADAAKDLEDAQQDLNEAMRDTQRIADEIAGKALDERRARLSVADAIDRVQDAEKELAEARKTGDPEKISDAERDLESSRLSVEESQLRLNEAERDAKEIREDAPKQADKIAQAEKRVRDAQIAQRESALGVAEAQENLNELRRKGSEQDEKVISARRRIVDVTRQQVDAEKDLAKAQKEVIKGEKEVVEAHKKVSDAQKEVNALGSETNKNTVALAGSMDALGETTRGAMANLVTAVARAAARVFTAFSKAGGDTNVLAGIMTNLRDTVDIVGKRFGAVAEDIAGSKGFGKVLAFFEGLPEKVDKALGDLEGKTLSEAFTSMVDKIDFGSLASKVIDGFFAALRKVPITKFSGVFTEIVLETLATSAASIVEGVIRIAPKIAVGVVAGFLRAFADNPISTTLFIGALGLPAIGPAIIGFMSKLPFGGLVAPLFRGLGGAVARGFQAFFGTTFGATLGVWVLNLGSALGRAVSGVPALFGRLLSGALGAGLRTAFTALVGLAASAVAQLVGAILVGIAAGFGLNWLIERVAPGVNRAIEWLGGALYDFFVALPGKVIGWLVELPGKLVDFFSKIPGIILGQLTGLPSQFFDLAFEMIGRFLKASEERVEDVLQFFRELPGNIIGIFRDAGTWLIEAGKAILDGLLAGFKAAARNVLRLIPFELTVLPQAVKDFFEIKSPSGLMAKIGSQVGEGLRLGLFDSLQDTADLVTREVARVSTALVPTVDTSRFTASVRGGDGSSALNAGRDALSQAKQQAQVIIENLNVNEAVTTAATARMLANDLAKALVR